MRLFIAIELPQPVRNHLLGVRDKLKSLIPKASFTRDVNLHITVKFLGEADDKTLAQLGDSLKHARSGGAVKIFAQKVECFPDRGPVRIVAAAFDGSLPALGALHQAIEQRCTHLGFERENRRYRPHVTLARARPVLPPQIRAATVQTLAHHFPGPEFEPDCFSLVQSRLLPRGSEYVTLARFPLAG